MKYFIEFIDLLLDFTTVSKLLSIVPGVNVNIINRLMNTDNFHTPLRNSV